ncbi:septal ring lytic transglycosylase RlpA family protein [Halopseudomonas phragmitis]|uniref:Endolytic peptidoglycan transglycosylase RlpA n=1 Tax=Halopseudomonas phragmitis TaxID=1931241 RepID=A0A1V0B0P4_9GAMM|nr:septal ring lytic transglycosylase RlpA family protein [Halopseudomonas phragmitis]AQZ93513.1 hypothetical protein BVH74_01465 [Halopseudomonas phragmitis]
MRRTALLGMLLTLLACTSAPAVASHGNSIEADWSEVGKASFYSSRLHGRRTASGEPYDQGSMTAAHPSLPFGTLVRVTNLNNGRSVVLRINDRGPFVGGRVIDVSRVAAEQLGMVRAGSVRVRVELENEDTL